MVKKEFVAFFPLWDGHYSIHYLNNSFDSEKSSIGFHLDFDYLFFYSKHKSVFKTLKVDIF